MSSHQSESTLAAIKAAVDIVALVGEYLPLHRAGSKYKALCPFHNDHNPSLELNPDRQSYKCWSCGAGGDVIDFVQNYERVEFPEALRMLADRAGVALDTAEPRPSGRGPAKTDLLEVHVWAESAFAEALAQSLETRAYVAARGITAESEARFHLGLAPERPDWLSLRARRDGVQPAVLEAAGLIVRDAETRRTRERFRGRLIFPIRDARGRTIAFGGRILPESEKIRLERGQGVAKYLNSPETALFQKRRHLYAADLARPSARQAGWVAVVEGYTDVIAAHQAGMANCVGTLGTALGDDHIQGLRRLADRVVLVFDGDEAGQKAADRSLELFLGHEIDARVLTLPDGLDPADFLNREGADVFRTLVEQAEDPLAFAIRRAGERFDFDSVEGARQAAESVLATLARIPRTSRVGLDVKVAKALDTLAQRLRLPVADLKRTLQSLQRPTLKKSLRPALEGEPRSTEHVSTVSTPPIRLADLDPIDRKLVQVVLANPAAVPLLITRVTAGSLRDAPLRAILQVAYDLHGEGEPPTLNRITLRLDDPALKALAAGLSLPIDPAPFSERVQPASPEAELTGLLAMLAERDWHDRLRDLKGALDETNREADPAGHQALLTEYLKLWKQRPDPRK
ncbi:MAG: DNA primase [Isosphaeraceae bacterium]